MTEIDQIKKILGKHDKRISDLEKLFKSKSVPSSIGGEGVILKLISSGFFDAPKKYGEIIKQLKIQAKFDKKYNHKKILNKLTSEDKLERKVVDHQWVYIKYD